ncbi:CCA tRNA nucleotidyltransferase [Pleomorphomonas diazotrophica]|uniref:CCA tRNA nucleotidyltransferase n=1 Tax=Pleomorphomonas diazotrophica TaxID=1166257 RepID=A0A1I4WQV5_9HYPH|nr:CCA tRNA nucleotidyltransferase [Pleomorphomonas diazotrophica]PKR87304.1 CCA tRNA nucleotidyltransferase [Pleomorphomonas diazotrophica]SFN15546.1 poly(A) polymerase [Pleomorphomonas diazotrophica]
MSPPASIAGAPFLDDPAFRRVIAAVEQEGDRARVVGGAVRNTLIGVPVDDVDIATTAPPAEVAARAAAAGLKAVPTGIEHGTVTVVSSGRPFEVTTLRADLETDGRRAVVAFTRDWAGDAARRDFTMNAIYADADGTLYDPVDGIADALAGRVRFIGDPSDRIEEDYLRILRFFRFHARYGHGQLDAAGLEAAVRLKDGLDRLSRERIGAEMRKLVTAVGAVPALAVMDETGILGRILPGGGTMARFSAVVDLSAQLGLPLGLEARLAALANDRSALAGALRLSGREDKRLGAIVEWSGELAQHMDAPTVRLAVIRAGNDVTVVALLLAAFELGRDPGGDLVSLARDFHPPKSPVTAARLLAEGYVPGPALGAELRRREAAWIAAGCPAELDGGV